jgi:uncharacterized membrane-anchored protein
MIIPISGYDPRDLLSGHYLTYRLDIKTEKGCSKYEYADGTVYLCLEKPDDGSVRGYPVENITEPASDECAIVIKGKCRYNRFIAGVERFYIPEEHAEYLDAIIRKGKCSLKIKIDSKGNASIKDMLIDGKSWKEYLKEKPE